MKNKIFSNFDIKSAIKVYTTDSVLGKEHYGDITTWDVSNVTDMTNLFQGIELSKDIDLSSWDVSNVTSMHGMFCESRIYLENGIQNWVP